LPAPIASDNRVSTIRLFAGIRGCAYLDAAGRGTDIDGPLFRPLRHNGKQRQTSAFGPRCDRPRGAQIRGTRLDRGYSAHSMRAKFITRGLENRARLEDVQKAAGHRDPSTTKLYDRHGYNPEKAASFFRDLLKAISGSLRAKRSRPIPARRSTLPAYRRPPRSADFGCHGA